MTGIPVIGVLTVAAVMRTVWGTFGIAVALISAAFLAMAIGDLVTGEGNTARSTLVGLVVLFLGAGLWGLNIARQSFGWRLPAVSLPRRKTRSVAEKEQSVLALAASVGGRVTLVETAGRCQLSLEEAEEILNSLAAREFAELLVADDGTVVYAFDVLTRKETARAKDIL